MSSGSVAEDGSIGKDYIELAELAELQQEHLIRLYLGRLRQRIASWSELVTPNTDPLLSKEEGRVHEKVRPKGRNIIWSQPFHYVYFSPSALISDQFQMSAEF